MYGNGVKSIAIGTFDGMHRAHMELISMVDEVVVIEHGRGSLTPGFRRSDFSPKPCAYRVLERIKEMSPTAFIASLVEDYPKLEKIVVGYDFRFGKDREGTPETISALFGGEVVVVDEISVNGVAVHSGTIRRLLSAGDIESANSLLGRRYRIVADVVEGQGLGRKELVPTINLDVKEYMLPAEGVYATMSLVDGEWYRSVSFFGHRRSTDGSYAVETHLIDIDMARRPREVSVEFISRIRENRRFDKLSDLRMRIYEDIEKALSILSDSGCDEEKSKEGRC
jgi:riboflavin kinase/FMN adenylyltransferase